MSSYNSLTAMEWSLFVEACVTNKGGQWIRKYRLWQHGFSKAFSKHSHAPVKKTEQSAKHLHDLLLINICVLLFVIFITINIHLTVAVVDTDDGFLNDRRKKNNVIEINCHHSCNYLPDFCFVLF